MSDHQTLQKAYRDLGMDGGEAFDAIKRRHKRLIMVWHPDRFQNPEGKAEAEAELKKINNAKDLLSAHFERAHSDSPQCSCRFGGGTQSSQPPPSDSATKSNSGPGPGPGRRRTTQEHDTEEEQARQRSRERAQRAAAEAAEQDAQAKAASAAAAAQRKSNENAVEQRKIMQEESLRWKLSMGLGAAWLILSFYGWAGTGLKAWWHDFSWKWERDHRPAIKTETPPATTPRYIPPYEKYPGGNDAAYQNQAEIDQRRRDEEAEKKKQQDIYNTRMDIDKQQKIIQHCTEEIAKIDAQLDSPSGSDIDKRNALNFQNSQKGYLFQAQNDLNSANQHLSELTGLPAPKPIVPTSPVSRTFQSTSTYQPTNMRRGSRFGVQTPIFQPRQDKYFSPSSPLRVKPFQPPVQE